MVFKLNLFFVLAGCFQAKASDYRLPPAQCLKPPAVQNPERCCNIEQFYSTEEFNACNVSANTKPGDCGTILCLLRNKKVLKENNDLIIERVSEELERWAQGKPFLPILPKVREVCLKPWPIAGPAEPCEQGRLFQCVGSVWFNNCPDERWEKSENCAVLKKHIQLCNPR